MSWLPTHFSSQSPDWSSSIPRNYSEFFGYQIHFSPEAVRFGNFAGCSDLPGSRFWVHTCGTLQQLQDKEFPEVAGNISMTSVHTDQSLDLDGIILLSQEGGNAWEACSVLRRSKRVTTVPPTCCNSRTLLLQITPLQKCSQATPSSLKTLKNALNPVPKSKTYYRQQFKN